ncbi:MAG: MarR family transcriptional regulator [Burkholderiales bacterium]|jgi:DNA-binding MarR family transcriptional regulator|nr:MarR family transcriptional regulator [Burkholderiales bacterium]
MNNQLINTLLRNIDTIAREMHAIYELKFKSYKLQRGQFLFLTRICETPGINLQELSYQLKMDKTTITKAVQKLMVAGYINKSTDIKDRRISHLTPTSKATNIYKEIISEKNRLIEICFKSISPKNSEILSKLIETMLSNINDEWNRRIKTKNDTIDEPALS